MKNAPTRIMALQRAIDVLMQCTNKYPAGSNLPSWNENGYDDRQVISVLESMVAVLDR